MNIVLRSLRIPAALSCLCFIATCYGGADSEKTATPGQIFVVTHTGASGPGSFRQAILDANARQGLDAIHFKIERAGSEASSGPFTIPERTPGDSGERAPLPQITDSLAIDGYTQPGAARATAAQPAKLLIEIKSTLHFTRETPGSSVAGLAINESPGSGLIMQGKNNRVEGNYIGTDVTGSKPLGNAEHGLIIDPSYRSIIVSNLVSANGGLGIILNEHGQPLGENIVRGNKIGTDVSGAIPMGNRSVGLFVWTHSNTIEDNVIAFNGSDEIPASGIILDNSYANARFNVIRRNIISDHPGRGILVRARSQGNTFSENSIFRNGGLGIDLGGNGRTLNDPLDKDDGENSLQNFPVLDPSRSGIRDDAFFAAGSLNSEPECDYLIELFGNDPGEAKCETMADPIIWLKGEASVRNIDLGRAISVDNYSVAQARADFKEPGHRQILEGTSASAVFSAGGGASVFSAASSLFPIARKEPEKGKDNFISEVSGTFRVDPDANKNDAAGEEILVTWALFSDDGAEFVIKGGPFFFPDPDSFDPALVSIYREHDGISANWYSPAYRTLRLREGAEYEFEAFHFEAGGAEGLTLAYGLGDQRDNVQGLVPLASKEIADSYQYRSPECGANAFFASQGRRFLKSFKVRTDAKGRAEFEQKLARESAQAGSITATATRLVDGAPKGTSEFSEAMEIR